MNTVYYFEDLILTSRNPGRLIMVFLWNMALNATRDGILLWFCKVHPAITNHHCCTHYHHVYNHRDSPQPVLIQ